jgi:nitrate reductase molybdenum cofactor assembly chaperone NarJ/NarW
MKPAESTIRTALLALARLLEYPGPSLEELAQQARAAVRGSPVARSLLTPALSPRERENCIPSCGNATVTTRRAMSVKRAKPGGEAEAVRNSTRRDGVFPLPEGEGQGEGKGGARDSGALVALDRFASCLAALSQEEREELYTTTFDVTPACVPYVSIHLFGEENFKRGEFMAGLQARYQQTAFTTAGELPDHLSVLLRFAAHTDEAERRELVEFCLLGPVGKMIGALSEANPYRALLEAVRDTLQAAYPGLQPAPSPVEAGRQQGTGAAFESCSGCGPVASHEPTSRSGVSAERRQPASAHPPNTNAYG